MMRLGESLTGRYFPQYPVRTRRGATEETPPVARCAHQVLVRRAETGDVVDKVAAGAVKLSIGATAATLIQSASRYLIRV